MVTSRACTPDEYIARLPDERREAVSAVRDVINANLPRGSSRKSHAATE